MIVMFRFLAAFFCISVGVFYYLSAPTQTGGEITLIGDPKNGEYVYHAAGCGGCHRASDATDGDMLVLSGGQKFPSPFGTFISPNVSMDVKFGIGSWTQADFVRAIRNGVSPDGKHYYPAFPYTSYQGMSDQDVVDLWSFWQRLPSSNAQSVEHELPVYAQWRRLVGFWKLIAYKPNDQAISDPILMRGAYLVGVLGHCGECHTSRNILGATVTENTLLGAKHPSGKGRIPAIAGSGFTWSVEDIAEYLNSGFTPDYDVAGGLMAEVIENTSKLSTQDRTAIATYLKAHQN